jgi:hypothetical protein
MLTMKGSGCVRVTASGACAIIGSLKTRSGSRANAAFDPLQCHMMFVENMFRSIMSSMNPAFAATQSFAKASGDEDDPDRARRTFAAAKPLNGVAPHRRRVAKSRPRSALPYRRGLEFMFEAQVKVYVKRLGSVRLSLADDRPFRACRPRSSWTAPLNENRTGFLASRRCGATRAGAVSMRFANGQQNAHRRDPSGGDPGGGFARQPRRRIRF